MTPGNHPDPRPADRPAANAVLAESAAGTGRGAGRAASAEGPDAVCVIRLSAIGDCCHTLPVLRTLQAAWPRTRITWIIGGTEHRLFSGADGIEFITFDKARPRASRAEIRRRLSGRNYPVLLHMHASMRANLVSTAVPARRRIGFDRARARDWQWLFTNERIAGRPGQHAMDALFGFAEHLGIRERVLRWDFPIPDEDRAMAGSLRARHGGPLVVISPLSSQRFRNYRNWSADNYAAVARGVVERHGARIVLTGGDTPLEREYAERIVRPLGRDAIDLVGRTTLKELYAILEAADLLICPDSGPAHMATAAGTPVVGLYATSNRHRTGPYFSQHLVVDRYPEAVRREFGVGVGSLRWGRRVRNPDAMSLIGVAEVLERADEALRTWRRASPGAGPEPSADRG